jgi:hypothetical protein
VDGLEGQPRIESELHFSLGPTTFSAMTNRMDINEDEHLGNLRPPPGAKPARCRV